MNNSKIIIPFGELVNRSLSYVMYNFAVLFKMMIVPVLLMFAVQLLLPKLGISLFVMMIISSYIGVACCRKIVLNEAPVLSADYFRYMLVYMLRYIGISLFIIATGSILLSVVYLFGDEAAKTTIIAVLKNQSPSLEVSINIYLYLLIAFFVAVFYSVRLRLSLASAAVNDQNINMLQAFQISKGNTWRLFGGFVLANIPVLVIYFILLKLAMYLPDNLLWGLVFAFLGTIANGIDICIKSSYDAHVYQYFAYFYHKQIEDAEAAAAKQLVEEEIKRRRD